MIVDAAGFASLRAAGDPAVAVVDAPLVTLTLQVAGPDVRLEHRGWIDRERATLLVALQPERFQVITVAPAFLTAALVRLTRIRPRRPDAGGVDFEWELHVDWAGGGRTLLGQDGPGGLRLADPLDGTFRPVTNTEAYRILSTVLPTDAELPV